MRKHLIFLDADGVLWPDLGAGSILTSYNLGRNSLREFSAALNERSSYFISIITNQTLAARGAIPFEIFRDKVNGYFEELIQEGLINHFEVCFHHPRATNLELRQICSCRKPAPGMLLNTMSKFNMLDYEGYVIGDRITDLLAAEAAGVAHKILIPGEKSMEMNDSGGELREFPSILSLSLVDDLREAASVINWIRENDK
jgi:D-glycero-D-manno-heptose 1,7-bisphosphate phosphatase